MNSLVESVDIADEINAKHTPQDVYTNEGDPFFERFFSRPSIKLVLLAHGCPVGMKISHHTGVLIKIPSSAAVDRRPDTF